jgi:hypothetical protein
MADLNGHAAGNGGYSQGKPTAYRDSSTRRDAIFRQLRQSIRYLLRERDQWRKRASWKNEQFRTVWADQLSDHSSSVL